MPGDEIKKTPDAMVPEGSRHITGGQAPSPDVTDAAARPADELPATEAATPSGGMVDPGVTGDHVAPPPPVVPDADLPAASPSSAHAARIRGEVPRPAVTDSGEFAAPPPTLPDAIKDEIAASTTTLSVLHSSVSTEGRPVTDYHIKFAMKTIHETFSLLPREFDPFNDTSEFREIAGEASVLNFFAAALENLLDIVKAAPKWTGIQLFARRLSIVSLNHGGRREARLHVLTTEILSQTEEGRRYKSLYDRDERGRVTRHPEERTIEEERRYFLTIEPSFLPDPGYRRDLARDLFHLSRGNPELETRILTDLYGLYRERGETARGVVKLLREFIPLSHPSSFSADDALLVRDYGPVLGQDEPAPFIDPSQLFTPDEWTQVMVAGLKAIFSQNNFEGKEILEIGTGEAILTLAAANHSRASKIWSVDINPIAPIVATLNIALNHSDTDGNLTSPDVLKRFRFGTTADLFEGIPAGKKFALIFACIPQAPAATENVSARQRADNYIARGDPEDIDGLGLLAQLLEQAEPHLEEGGRVALIVSGRPGLMAVERMANLRGWTSTTVYQTVIPQERRNTSLAGYVAIEQMGLRLPFEFWLGDRQITAAEASALLDEFQQKLRTARSAREIAAVEADPKYQVTHRQYIIEFRPLSHLQKEFRSQAMEAMATRLRERRHVRYFADTGSEFNPFRNALSNHLSSMTGMVIPPETLFVAPSLERLLYNFCVTTVEEHQSIYIDPTLTLKDPFWKSVVQRWRIQRFPDSANDRLRIFSLANPSLDFATALADAHAEKRFLVFVATPRDGTRLHSLSNILLEHAEYRDRVAIIWQNTHLPVGETPLATMILWNKTIYETMAHLGKDTYSRVSLQAVYEAALLLAQQSHSGFEIDFARLPRVLPGVQGAGAADIAPAMRKIPGIVPGMAPAKGTLGLVPGRDEDLTVRARALTKFLSHPAALVDDDIDKSRTDIIDMSFGQSEFLIPKELVGGLVESLSENPTDADLRSAIAAHLNRSRGIDLDPAVEIRFGAGVHPLLSQTLRVPAIVGESENFSILLPEGHYGYFPSTIHAAGGEAATFPTDPKGKPEAIAAAMETAFARAAGKGKPVRAILLQYPTNPAGLFYTKENLRAIVSFCKAKGIYILADEVFFNTARSRGKTTVFGLLQEPEYREYLEHYLIGYSGASKSPGLGGLRFGFIFSKNRSVLGAIAAHQLEEVDPFARKIAHKIYQPEFRLRYIRAHLTWLEAKRGEMVGFLSPYRDRGMVRFADPEGGYFLEADVSPLFGRTITHEGTSYTIAPNGSNFRDVLFEVAKIHISPVGWAGRPNTVRLVYSIENLSEGLRRLKRFLDAFETPEGRGEVVVATPTPSLGGVIAVTTDRGDTTDGDDPNVPRMAGGLRLFDGNAALELAPVVSLRATGGSEAIQLETSSETTGLPRPLGARNDPSTILRQAQDGGSGQALRLALIRYATRKRLQKVSAFLVRLNDEQVRRLVVAAGRGESCIRPDGAITRIAPPSRTDHLLATIASRIGAYDDLVKIVPEGTAEDKTKVMWNGATAVPWNSLTPSGARVLMVVR